MKKFIGTVCALLLLMTSTACIDGPGDLPGSDVENLSKLSIWTAPSTVKIMQNGSVDYSSVKGEAELSLLTVKNEYESAQLIFSAEADVKEYDLAIENLVLEGDSSVVYAQENIDVYNQKYIEVKNILTSINVPKGMYPDALIPMEKAIEHKENNVKKGNNQGIWVEFYIPKNQAAGTYTGEFTVKYDGQELAIPVSLTVADAEISDERHNQSVFLTGWSFEAGELDSTNAMLQKYNETLMDYRLAPNALIQDTSHSDEDIAYYAELAYGYLSSGKCSNIAIPTVQVTVDGYPCISQNYLVKYLNALAKEGVENGLNVLEDVVVYNAIIDEPHNRLPDEQVIVNLREFNAGIATFIEGINESADIPESAKAEIIAAANSIPCLVTAQWYEEIADVVKDYCPQVQWYDTAELRAYYANQEEKWWYTCTDPKNPYPSYHIEDHLVSSRVLSWMQACYGVEGNLYWAVDLYKSLEMDAATGNQAYENIEDVYQQTDRYPTANGDGFLFYPGKYYGIDGPITSMRLHSIRDGLEEYEMIYALAQKYDELISVSGQENGLEQAMSYIYERLFTGTKSYTTSEQFALARESLIKLLALANGQSGFAVNGIKETADGYEIKVQVNDGFEVKINEQTASCTAENGCKVYSFTLSKGGVEKAVINVSGASYEESVQLYFSGETTSYNLVENASSVTSELGTVNSDGTAIKIAFDNGLAKKHSINLGGALVSSVGKDTDKVLVKLTVDNPVDYELRFKYSGKQYLISVQSGTLAAGENVISVTNLFGYNWADYEGLEQIQIVLGTENDSARTVVINGYEIVSK